MPEKIGVLPYFSIGTFEKIGVRIKKLEYNNPNLELVRTLSHIVDPDQSQLIRIYSVFKTGYMPVDQDMG